MNIQYGQRIFQIILAIRETDLMKRMVDETRASSPVFPLNANCFVLVYCCGSGGTFTMATKTSIRPLAWSHADNCQLLQNNYTFCLLSVF